MKHNIIDKSYANSFWMQIYGSPKKTKDKEKRDIMNRCPSLATLWKGRILMQIESEEAEKPKQSAENIP